MKTWAAGTHLGLTKDNVGVRSRVLVNVRFVDDEEDVPGLADSDAADSNNLIGRKCLKTQEVF